MLLTHKEYGLQHVTGLYRNSVLCCCCHVFNVKREKKKDIYGHIKSTWITQAQGRIIMWNYCQPDILIQLTQWSDHSSIARHEGCNKIGSYLCSSSDRHRHHREDDEGISCFWKLPLLPNSSPWIHPRTLCREGQWFETQSIRDDPVLGEVVTGS